MKLKNKIAIITGAGTGIGKAMSSLFCREGAAVALAGLASTPLSAVASELTKAGGRAIAISCDVGLANDAGHVVAETVARFGGLDILINNAAISISKNLMDLTREDWDRVLNANLTGQFLMAQAATSEMRKRGGGSIVNISSVQERISEPQSVAYATSKGGVAQLTRSLAIELGPFNIAVNAISPGFVANTQLSFSDGVDETTTEKFKTFYLNSGRIPLCRAGTTDDIAAAALFLAARECTYITGTNLTVDGGLTLTL
jgi:NAD(P)-dependent dehydrogenase (short-subunit alcohol dehydrogenase family)